MPIDVPETCEELTTEADEVVCAITPEPFVAVSLWYEDFAQTSDEEVLGEAAALVMMAREGDAPARLGRLLGHATASDGVHIAGLPSPCARQWPRPGWWWRIWTS